MNCPNHNVLRAYLDSELDPLELSALKEHLLSCSNCQERCQAFSSVAAFVSSQLGSLAFSPAESNPQMAFARFKANLPDSEERPPFLARLFSPRWRLAWSVSLVVAIVAISLAFPAARSFAQRLLATLRVERVQTVNLDFGPLEKGMSRQPIDAFAKLLSENAVVTTDEKGSSAATRDAASQDTGFPVRLVSARSDQPAFEITGAHAFHMTLDRSRLQDILDQSGRSDLMLPASIDGASVSVQIPRAVAVSYGSCKMKHADQTNSASPAPANSPMDPCLLLIQAPSPVVNVPSDLNIQQLAEIGLQLAGWNPEKARQFCQSVDWRSTLVLPIPRAVDSSETVSINGTRGTLLRFPPDSRKDKPAFALIWIENGIIYNLMGTGDSATAVQLASSLQ
jgi:Putative zinc-finger